MKEDRQRPQDDLHRGRGLGGPCDALVTGDVRVSGLHHEISEQVGFRLVPLLAEELVEQVIDELDVFRMRRREAKTSVVYVCEQTS